MTITEVCIAARELNMSYGAYVAKYLPRPVATVQKKVRHSREEICYQYSLDGVLIAKYASVTEAAAALDVNVKYLMSALRGEKPSAYGFCWRFADTPAAKEPMIHQYTDDGVLVAVYPTIAAAKAATGNGHIWRAIKEKKKANGYYWERKLPE